MSSPSRSGAFEEAADHRVELFTESVSFDRRLYRQDIAGSVAHAHMLADQNILTAEEASQIQSALEEIQLKIESGE
ncbi:MAG: lyase family protein, partial [Planctomycetota bacterium]|nr:lyase family protein [Planctomycetota bacterium]